MKSNKLYNTDEKTLLVVSMQDLKEFALCILANAERPKEECASEKMLSSEEVCAALHIKDTTLWRWCKAGMLPFTKVGKRRLFNSKDVEAVITR